MIPKQAIEKAIEGGWDGEWDNVLGAVEHRGAENACGWEPVALSPSFWQALAKALGRDWDMGGLKCECSPDIFYSHKFCPKCGTALTKVESFTTHWSENAMKFYDLILTNGDTEKFWNDLLTR